jgi:hypothetical protein
MRSTRSIALLALVLTAPALAADSPAAKVADLAWMSGHWEGPLAGGTLEENWAQPKSGSIASLVRQTTAEKTAMIELIVIEEENDSLVLRVQQWNPGFSPRTPGPQVMKLVESAENKVVFEATGEGGLSRLGYSRPAPDRFVISIRTAQGRDFDIPLTAK